VFKLLNCFLVLTVLGSAAMLYDLEHTTRGLERDIAKVKRSTQNDVEAIKLLKAEWASLTRPERIQQLAEQNFKLAPIHAQQFVTAEELASRIPDAAVPAADAIKTDAIGALLEKMQ
jgi:cell division protein FtsL